MMPARGCLLKPVRWTSGSVEYVCGEQPRICRLREIHEISVKTPASVNIITRRGVECIRVAGFISSKYGS